jgi:hypothetical protein
VRLHDAPDRARDPRAQAQGASGALAPQVDVAVAQARLVGDVLDLAAKAGKVTTAA